jgi:hypothetical protein
MTKPLTSTENLLSVIAEKFRNGEIDNNDLVQIIELCGDYLNLKTRTNYAKDNGKSYNGAKNFRRNITLFGCKFIIDND